MKYFGTDGFRGEVNKTLTVEHAYKVGRFLGDYFKGSNEKAKIIIGKDTRRSSYMLESALAAGITASGSDAYMLHVTPTPSVSYVVRTEGFDCGVMISASHNSYYDNGIKVINNRGYKLAPEIEEKIEAYIDEPEDSIALATKAEIGKVVDFAIGRNRYIGHLISLATRSFKNKTIALDLSNGAASSVAKGVFDTLGAKTLVINSEPDGLNINENCGSTHIEILQEFVKKTGADAGFAYDGDADRCLAVDDKGEIMEGDCIMYLCGKYLKEKGELNNNTVVTTVMSNMGLYKAFDEEGISYEQTAVGDKYVCENMMSNGHSLGGENSGHIIFSKYAVTGDGILTSLMLMEVMLESKKSFSELRQGLKIYPQLLENVKVKDKKEAREDPDVIAAEKMVEQELGSDGRLLLRESGTEALVRVMVEAKTDEICREEVGKIVAVLKKNGHVIS